MLYHVTGKYHWTDVLFGRSRENTVNFDTFIEATDEDAAINRAICQEIVEMPEYENDDDMEAEPATAAQVAIYEAAQAYRYQQQYSEPLFVLQ